MPKQVMHMPILYVNKVKFKPQATVQKREKMFLIG